MGEKDVYQNLKKAVLEYDKELAASSAKEAVEKKVDLLKALDAMTEAIRFIGDGFSKGEFWLPDLIGAGNAMSSATPIIEAELRSRDVKTERPGIVVIGAVFGDIHSIGKNIVATLLIAEGFEVHDLGVDVKAEEFEEAITKYKANLLCMSALLTMSAPEQRKVIDVLKEKGVRGKVKIMVGGAAINADFAESIGADGYEPTALGAAKLARKLVGR